MRYLDRKQAGITLATALSAYTQQPNTIILALPRGGVPVAFEVAQALQLPLDVCVVRKLGVPDHTELAMGAIASGGTVLYNETLVQSLHLKVATLQGILSHEQQELTRREQCYRGQRPFPSLTQQTVILIDDGIATGATMKAAILAIKAKHPQAIIVAVPVAAIESCDEIRPMVQTLICPLQVNNLQAVGMWYDAFPQTTDEEVIQLLNHSSSL